MLLASVPKSGTYLLRGLLEHAGLLCDPRHIHQGENPPFEVVGDFRVGHPPCHEAEAMFLHRNLRDVLISSRRFDGLPVDPDSLTWALWSRDVPDFKLLVGWMSVAERVVRFEDLVMPRKVAAIVEHMGKRCNTSCALRHIAAIYNTKTRTWSGRSERTDWRAHWTPDVERAWRQSWLFTQNEELGYE